MPIISFPSNPYIGQQYSATNNLSYIWDGEKWSSMASLFGGGTNYILPAASNSVLGGVKIGSNITVDGSGVISVAVQIQSDWTQTNAVALDYIKNKPTIPAAQIQSDWNVSDNTLKSYIANKPNVPQLPTNAVGYLYNNGTGTLSWATVTGGTTDYNNLTNKPTIPAAQVSADWNSSSGVTQILNKPTIPAAQVSADWNSSSGVTQILNKPSIPTSFSSLVNGAYTLSLGSTGNTTFPTGLTLGAPRGVNTVNFTSAIDKEFQIETGNSTTSKLWRFGTDGTTTFPTNISINYSGGNVQFPRIIADSGKAFSVQGQGASGSAAMSWTVDPDAAGQYAQIGVTKNGGDNLAKVILTAQSDSSNAGTAKTWRFNETGTLTLPAGGVIAEGGGFTGAIKLTPAGGANAYQSLVIYPTAAAPDGDHLHLTAGGGTTELYLGNDNHYVKLVNGGNVEVRAFQPTSPYATAVWGFDTDGNIDAQQALGIKVPNGVPSSITDIGMTTGSWELNPRSNLATTGGSGSGLRVNVTETGGYASAIAIATAGTGYTAGELITVTSGSSSASFIIAVTGNRSWTFGTDGKLTSPGNLQVNGGKIILNTGGNAYVESVDYGVNSANSAVNIFGGPYQKINLRAGFGTQATWTFGTDGNLTLPGNLVIAGNASVFGTNAALIAPDPDLPLIALSAGANGSVSSVWVEDPFNVGTSNIAAVYANPTPGSGIVRIVVGQNGVGSGPNLWDFGTDGRLTLPASGDVVDSTSVSQLARRFEGSWTVTNGTSTYSFTVPMDGTYTMWVKGNIPNGIITWNATLSISNTNVPAIGTQYAWNYTGGGSPILLTAIPNQIRGTAGTISTDNTYAGTTSNRFDFGISNTSGANQTIYYGYIRI